MKPEARPKEQFDRFVARQPRIKQNFAIALAASGKTQKQVALDIDLDPGTLSKIMNGYGNPRISTCILVAEQFNCSVELLFGTEQR